MATTKPTTSSPNTMLVTINKRVRRSRIAGSSRHAELRQAFLGAILVFRPTGAIQHPQFHVATGVHADGVPLVQGDQCRAAVSWTGDGPFAGGSPPDVAQRPAGRQEEGQEKEAADRENHPHKTPPFPVSDFSIRNKNTPNGEAWQSLFRGLVSRPENHCARARRRSSAGAF